jgi:predicted nucleic acid-binding protein
MTAECLLDTNILVYAVDSSKTNKHKQQIARDLIANTDFGLSAQVLQEFYVTVTRKLKPPLTSNQALRFISPLQHFPIVATNHELIRDAILLSEKHQISYWDAAVVTAAEYLQAKTLYSEDLNHGQQYGNVQAINPFI